MKKLLVLTFSGVVLLAFIIKLVSPSNVPDDEITPFASSYNSREADIATSSEDSGTHYSENNKAEIIYEGFKVLYNQVTRQPVWVDYNLTSEQVYATENSPKVPHNFMRDPRLDLSQQSDEDYIGVHKKYGLSKGHMAKHQDLKWSPKAVAESDYYTNICPQFSKLNSGVWKSIEDMVRKIAVRYDSVHIICGPLFIDTLFYIGPNQIPVPSHFFKLILVKNPSGYHSIAFVCRNTNEKQNMDETLRTVNEVEILTGIDVYSYIPDAIESIVEGQIDMELLEKK